MLTICKLVWICLLRKTFIITVKVVQFTAYSSKRVAYRNHYVPLRSHCPILTFFKLSPHAHTYTCTRLSVSYTNKQTNKQWGQTKQNLLLVGWKRGKRSTQRVHSVGSRLLSWSWHTGNQHETSLQLRLRPPAVSHWQMWNSKRWAGMALTLVWGPPAPRTPQKNVCSWQPDKNKSTGSVVTTTYHGMLGEEREVGGLGG